MALLFDEFGSVIGDDGTGNTGGATGSWEEETPTDSGFVATQAAKFQAAMNDVAVGIDNLNYLLTLDLPQTQRDAVTAQFDEISARKTAMKFTAEAFNTVADIGNAMGASLPKLAVPSGLGFAILGVPVAGAAAIAGAVALTAAVVTWVATTHSVALSAAESLAEPQRSQALARIAATVPSGGAAAEISTAVKWVALAAVAYFAWQAYEKRGS